MKRFYHTFFYLLINLSFSWAQVALVEGEVKDFETQKPLKGATVLLKELNLLTYTDSMGKFQFKNINYGIYQLVFFSFGKQTFENKTDVNQSVITVNVTLKDLSHELDPVTIQAEQEKTFGITRLKSVEGLAIYEAKKSEVIVLQDITANLATNNPRQVYAKIAGLNIWESDGAGLQLGIGGRGLSPNRTSNFNTRQNGYDISADALGYPESYYTPPTEALERIEIVRGAASLQYGTQFGGMLNFVFKKGNPNKKIGGVFRQTLGSFGFLGSFNSLSGTIANQKLTYYAFFQRKQGNGWRPNSGFFVNTSFISLKYQFSPKFSINAEYTGMYYLAQQPGGLTDVLFERNPRQSIRSRNWFQVNWNLLSLSADYRFSDRTMLNIRNFTLQSGRQSLGNLSPINNVDFGMNRDMIDGNFNNFGNETRLLHRYQVNGKVSVLLTGFRLYKGTTSARQGEANNSVNPDFYFLNPDNLEKSDYIFPNYNYSLFAENIFYLSPKLSLTSGIRFENIRTFSKGYYNQRVFDAAGNLVSESKQNESKSRLRSLVLAGLGISLKPNEKIELYGNISQNYRAINFTDLRIDNPNGRVDPNIQDERGYTADLGFRGNKEDWFNFDITIFYLAYKQHIGLLLKADEPPLFNDYRLRTNIGDSQNIGIEVFGEVNLWKWLRPQARQSKLSYFVNFSAINARYTRTNDTSIKGKKVELVPPMTLRTGLNFSYQKFSTQFTYAYITEHFTDATNARRTSSAVNGIIPAYQVADISASYHWRFLTLEGSCNNLFNAYYFTRRADAYPGPGIIPADGRSFFITLQATF